MKLDDLISPSLEVLRALTRIEAQALPPAEAQREVDAALQGFPAVAARLESEREEYAGATHYDAYVSLPDLGTVVLSLCPERDLPFIARAAYRISEQDLVRVGSKTLKIQEAIQILDVAHDPTMTRSLVDTMLVAEARQTVDPEALAPTEEELELALNAFRRDHGLFTVDATIAWLEQRGMTQHALERLLDGKIRVVKLRDRLVDAQVTHWFERHRAELETLTVARVSFDDPEVAARFPRAAGAFWAAATEAVAIGSASRLDVERIRVRDLEPGLAGLVGAEAGVAHGPLPTKRGHDLALIVSRQAAALDDPTEFVVREALFREWLDRRRRETSVEWYWGAASAGATNPG